MDFQRITVYPFSIKKKGTFTMMKKLISLLLSLLPPQALAASDSDENNPPPTITETPAPDEPDDPIAVMCRAPGDTGSGGNQPID